MVYLLIIGTSCRNLKPVFYISKVLSGNSFGEFVDKHVSLDKIGADG